MTQHRKLVVRLVGAVLFSFAAAMALTWALHVKMTAHTAYALIDSAFRDVEGMIRERVDQRMIRQAMELRDRVDVLRTAPRWKDPVAMVPEMQRIANELMVDEVCVAGPDGLLTHSANPDDIGFDYNTATGQASEFVKLLDRADEVTQGVMPQSRTGAEIKYVGVWMPSGGFVQVGARPERLRRLSRTAVTGLTHNWHISGNSGYVVIVSSDGAVISHPDKCLESGLWNEPGNDCYWDKRTIEGFSVYVVIPKRMAILERRLLVGTTAFLNGAALVLAAILVGIVIASYVRSQVRSQRAKEMKMASDIQESAIPRVFPPFPEERRVDIFGSMKTAKDVGGDFYDFYYSGPGKITFLIADVSDKGVPAALFMMRAKTIIKSIAQTCKPVAEVVTEANDALCEGNGADMFVTAWVGEIDIGTGHVSYVNAGHNPPVIIPKRTGKPEPVAGRSGPPLGAMPGMKYRARELDLARGDKLYLYTDGVTDQQDPHGKMLGEEGLLEILAKNGMSDHIGLVNAVADAVQSHAAGEERCDDCTQLVIRYNGEEAPSRSFPARMESLPDATAFLDGELSAMGCPAAAQNALDIILDELASNIVRYSGASEFEIGLARSEDPAGVTVSISDDGAEYDPLSHTDPDTSLPAAERPIGGLGILMVRRMADSVSYSRSDGRNRVDAFKKF